ncbi:MULTISPECIES: TIGR04255 family protein [unclassified Luteococcus]|uniref:TIGR04255 family protein n=1 Tax=unclassified Luteococcus TaxID=2639923 RepID=UPI00313B7814
MNKPFGLSGEHYTLDRPPAVFSVFEVRYGEGREHINLQAGYDLQEFMSKTFPGGTWKVEKSTWQEAQVELTPQGPRQQSYSEVGVRLTSSELSCEMTFFPSRAAVQVSQYTRWSTSLKPLVSAAVLAVEQLLKPVGRDRVGLRYVNNFQDQKAVTPGFWDGKIEPSLLGPVAGGPFTGQLRDAQSQLVLDLGGGAGAVLRHGLLASPAAPASVGYLLDIDTFDEHSARFDAEDVITRAEVLNRNAAELFQRSLTERFSVALGKRKVESQGNGDMQ